MKKQKNSTENNENLSLNDIIVNNKVKANKSDNKVSYKLRQVNRRANKNRKEKNNTIGVSYIGLFCLKT